MKHVQITNGYYEAKKNLEKALCFFNEMNNEYDNLEKVFYEDCKDDELDTIREDLSHIEDAIYCIEGALDEMKRINIDIDYEL